MKLLIDIGNSRCKWALEKRGRIHTSASLDYRQPLFFQQLTCAWAAIEPPRVAAIACVGEPVLLASIEQFLARLWPQSPRLLACSQAQALGVRNAYPQPEKLGVDRWLALLAAHRHYPGQVCIVDCGTAITVDVLDHGQHLGGWIAPGLAMMRKSLVSDAAALEFTSQTASMQFAANTSDAIANGTLSVAAALIAQAIRQLDAEYRLLLTGGDAQTIAAVLQHAVTVDVELVFKGLSVWVDEACSK